MARPRPSRRTLARLPLFEPLEDRRLLTSQSWTVLTYDAPLVTPPPAPVDGGQYTLRELVEYYNKSYNGAATEPFVIQLQPGTTYTLSNTTDASSVTGGRDNLQNEYGALDINPTQTTAPLVIQGGTGTVLTCITVGPYSDVPLDRLIHVIGGGLQLQGMTLKGGLALDNGSGNPLSDALGGGVLVNPNASLSLTNCAILSNSASGTKTRTSSLSDGYNAAGGGVYGSAGSTISVNGSTSFVNNWVMAGKGSKGTIGGPGGNAFGGGLAVAADVADPSAGTTTVTSSTSLSFSAQGARYPTFTNNRLNSIVLPTGMTSQVGGGGGTGSQVGGAGGNAYGGGLYLGSGQLNINGGSLASALVFTGNTATGGIGYLGGVATAGADGSASGGGASLAPGQAAFSDAPTSGGILRFGGNTATSYAGGTPATTLSGLTLPPIGSAPDTGSTSADGPWNLRAAVVTASALVSTGMDITLTLTGGSTYSLADASSGSNTGSLAVTGAGAGGTLTITGGGGTPAIISGGTLTASIFALNSARLTLSNLTLEGADAAGDGGALNAIDSVVTLSSVTLSGNASAGDGGGIYQSGGTLQIKNSTIRKNTAAGSGGGLFLQSMSGVNLTGARISSNQVNASGAAQGGGLYVSGGTLNANGLTVQNNQVVGSGGGMLQGAGIFASGTTFNVNGGSAGPTLVAGNTLNGNGAGSAFGAGLALMDGRLDVDGPLSVTGNQILKTASGAGGGIAFLAGAAYNASSTVTIGGNDAVTGGDDYAFAVTSTTDGNGIAPSGPNGIYPFTSGAGSLRGAIAYVQNMFALGLSSSMAILLPPGTYNLSSSPGQLVSNVPAGDSLAIIGQGGRATLKAGGTTRVLQVQNSGSLILQSLSITGGYDSTSGGGIYQQSGTLTLSDVTVTGNTAGPTGAATNPPNETYPYDSQHMTAPTGAAGASGYGGGIYLGGGTLNLSATTSITENTVRGQDGAPGEDGMPGEGELYPYIKAYPWLEPYLNGQKGGTGGAGGNALGGGLYQAGGELTSPVGASTIIGNTAIPGTGGAGGAGGSAGVYDGSTVGSPGVTGATGASGTGISNYANANGSTVFSAGTSAAPQAAVGGMYMTAGGIGADAYANTSTLKGLPMVSLRLYSPDGTLIATATTDAHGRFHFRTDYSGMGYIELVPIPVFEIPIKGALYNGGVVSGIDPTTRRSGLLQFISGTVANRGIDIVLVPVASQFRDGGNTVALRRDDDLSLLWRTAIVPKSYHGGFTVTKFDVNGDSTPDYLLIQKVGAARLSIVDGRTGAVTRIAGVVSAGLRRGMVVRQAANVAGDSPVLILSPKKGRSGRISTVDPRTGRVLWTSRQSVCGGMRVSLVGSTVPGRGGKTDIQLSSIRHPGRVKILNGQTGKVVIFRKPPPAAHGSKTAKTAGNPAHARPAGAHVARIRRASMATARRSARITSEHQPR